MGSSATATKACPLCFFHTQFEGTPDKRHGHVGMSVITYHLKGVSLLSQKVSRDTLLPATIFEHGSPRSGASLSIGKGSNRRLTKVFAEFSALCASRKKWFFRVARGTPQRRTPQSQTSRKQPQPAGWLAGCSLAMLPLHKQK